MTANKNTRCPLDRSKAIWKRGTSLLNAKRASRVTVTRVIRSQGRWTVIVLRRRRRSEFREYQDRRVAGRRRAQGRQLRLTVDIMCWWHACTRWITHEIHGSLSLLAQWHRWPQHEKAYSLIKQKRNSYARHQEVGHLCFSHITFIVPAYNTFNISRILPFTRMVKLHKLQKSRVIID